MSSKMRFRLIGIDSNASGERALVFRSILATAEDQTTATSTRRSPTRTASPSLAARSTAAGASTGHSCARRERLLGPAPLRAGSPCSDLIRTPEIPRVPHRDPPERPSPSCDAVTRLSARRELVEERATTPPLRYVVTPRSQNTVTLCMKRLTYVLATGTVALSAVCCERPRTAQPVNDAATSAANSGQRIIKEVAAGAGIACSVDGDVGPPSYLVGDLGKPGVPRIPRTMSRSCAVSRRTWTRRTCASLTRAGNSSSTTRSKDRANSMRPDIQCSISSAT